LEPGGLEELVMGHCPQYLLDAFAYWALDGSPTVAVVHDGLTRFEWSWRDLCTRLRGCDESMPSELCDWLGVRAGTSYATAAKRLLREASTPAPIRLRGVDADGFECGWNGIAWVRVDRQDGPPIGIDDADPAGARWRS
jgi:hypothetical protein